MYTRHKIGRKFIKDLEKNGVQLEGRDVFIERIEEIDQWQQGFYCLVMNGDKISLKASAEQKFSEKIKQVLEKYNFSDHAKNFCISKICGLNK
jgi:hypothetical protein